jgi:hypothetical protein
MIITIKSRFMSTWFSQFSPPFMSVLTPNEHKEPVWEAKANIPIQVTKTTHSKNKGTWHEQNHKGQSQLGKLSMQPRHKHMIPQEEAQRAQHRSWKDQQHMIPREEAQRSIDAH